ncbi:hypothetical protein DEFR109230_19260 [Deinococcus frigens]
MRTFQDALCTVYADRQSKLTFHPCDSRRGGPSQDGDAFLRERMLQGARDVFILVAQEVWGALNEGHLRSEAAVHLRVLHADIAPAHDQEVTRQFRQLQGAGGIEKGHVLQPGDARHRRTGPGVNEDLRCFDAFPIHVQGVRSGEAGLPPDQGDVRVPVHVGFRALPHTGHQIVLALHHLGQTHPDGSGVNSPLGGFPRQVRHAGTGDQGLGGNAPPVEAGAAQLVPLDQRDGASLEAQLERQRQTGHPPADHHGVVARHACSWRPRLRRTVTTLPRQQLPCGLLTSHPQRPAWTWARTDASRA